MSRPARNLGAPASPCVTVPVLGGTTRSPGVGAFHSSLVPLVGASWGRPRVTSCHSSGRPRKSFRDDSHHGAVLTSCDVRRVSQAHDGYKMADEEEKKPDANQLNLKVGRPPTPPEAGAALQRGTLCPASQSGTACWWPGGGGALAARRVCTTS